MQVFVCGMHRSGTSMVARLLNLMGMYFGPEGSALPVNRENPKGFWERRDVVDLNDRILAAANATWFDIHAYVARDEAPQLADDLSSEVRAALANLDAFRPWFIKDPRLCLTLPFWVEHCELPLVIVCSRDPSAVISSLEKRSEITGLTFSFREALALWESYNLSLLQATQALPAVFVRYEDVLASPLAQFERMYNALHDYGVRGLHRPTDQEILAFVDPKLQRSTASTRISDLPAWARDVDRRLLGDDAAAQLPQLSAEASALLAAVHVRLAQEARHRALLHAVKRHESELERLIAANWSPGDRACTAWSVAQLRELASRK